MKALITALHETAPCMWCQKNTEAVTVQFDGGFLTAGELCWKCLQQAARVHAKQQETEKGGAPKSKLAD